MNARPTPTSPPFATVAHLRPNDGRPDVRADRFALPAATEWASAAAAALLFAGLLVVARGTGFWLDEAQSVAIASRSPGQIVDALRHDGAPPLYYLLLHGWIGLAGAGDTAVRSMSALCAVAVAPLLVRAARVLWPAATGAPSVSAAIVLSSPFLLRYGTEARMYALVVLLAAGGIVALQRSLAGSPAGLVALAVLTGLLLLTHYWSFFLVAAVGGGLLVAAVRQGRTGDGEVRRHSRHALVAMTAGGLLFVPWIPVFAYQVAHTGAPWAAPPGWELYEATWRAFTGSRRHLTPLAFLTAGLLLIAVAGRSRGPWRVDLDLRPRLHPATVLLAALLAPLTLGLGASAALGHAFAPRYAAVVFPAYALLVAAGVLALQPRHAAAGATALAGAAGLFAGAEAVAAPRSQAPEVARAVLAAAAPNDLVVFCPDQLGPAVTRLVDGAVRTMGFPSGEPVPIVDWVEYAERVRAADPAVFGSTVAGGTSGAVWLVTAPGYRMFGSRCARLHEQLVDQRGRPEQVVPLRRAAYERASLWRFAPST